MVIISGHKLDSESGAFDVSKHGKHFYLLEHDHKVNYEDYLNCGMFHPRGVGVGDSYIKMTGCSSYLSGAKKSGFGIS